jgi:hypothetical protein
MKSTKTRKQLMILILAFFVLIISMGINALIDGTWIATDEKHYPLKGGIPSAGVHTPEGSSDTVHHPIAVASDRSPVAVPRRVILKLDQAARIGKADITYRGLESGSKFRIDVVIPEFDPQAVYPYRFHIGEAKKGFRLARREYRLISARKAYTHLYLLN